MQFNICIFNFDKRLKMIKIYRNIMPIITSEATAYDVILRGVHVTIVTVDKQ
jgi:hypothetical protein